MKPTSPLSLLLFLQFVSAAPIRLSPTDSRHPSTLRVVFSSHKLLDINHPSPTKHTDPHFPSHQLAPSTSLPEFNNKPLTPPADLPATIALTALQPLSSSYLLSLHSASTPADDALPAKPTSALAALRLEDAKRYWADRAAAGSPPDGAGTPSHHVVMVEAGRAGERVHLCSGARVDGGGKPGRHLAREYSDLIVVGIVVLFLVVVVALEAFERVADLRHILLGTRPRRGEIYLDYEDEERQMGFRDEKRPFVLRPAPMGRKAQVVVMERRVGADAYTADDEEGETDVEEGSEYEYDSDAREKE